MLSTVNPTGTFWRRSYLQCVVVSRNHLGSPALNHTSWVFHQHTEKYFLNSSSAGRAPSSRAATDFALLLGSLLYPFSCRRFILKTAADRAKPQRTQRNAKTWNGNMIHHNGEFGSKLKALIFLCDLCVLCGQLLFIDSSCPGRTPSLPLTPALSPQGRGRPLKSHFIHFVVCHDASECRRGRRYRPVADITSLRLGQVFQIVKVFVPACGLFIALEIIQVNHVHFHVVQYIDHADRPAFIKIHTGD
jgi:hypothetical protein